MLTKTMTDEQPHSIADKYARSAGDWCRIHYCVTLCPDLKAVKDYIRILRQR